MPLPLRAQVVDFQPDLSGNGTVNTPANGSTIVGIDATGTQSFSSSFSGTININPTNSALAKAGSGIFTISGATITGGEFHILDGAVAQTSGTTNVTFLSVGSGSNPFTGNAPSVGALNVSGGTLAVGTTFQVGDFGGIGTVNQSGGNVMMGGNGNAASLNIGNQGGQGTYNLSGGTLSFDGTGTTNFIVIGRNGASSSASAQRSSTGVLNLSGSGSMVLTNATLFIGSNGSATDPSVTPGSGTINQTGGTLTIDGGSRLFLAATGNGTYNLNGGTLQIGGSSLNGDFNNTGGTYVFNLGGGTIQAIGSALNGTVNATLVAGTTSTIDTNGLGVNWSGVLSGGGALAKTGAGTLALSAVDTFTGETDVNGGVLALVGSGSVASSSRVVANGTFDISAVDPVANITSLAGSGVVNLGANTLNVTAANDTFSGALTGTGALAMAGGSETLSGNSSTFAGPVQVNGGTLWVNGPLGTASTATTVASGAQLGGNGTLGGNVAVASGGILAPGPATQQVGTLAINGDLALSSGSILNYDFGQASNGGSHFNDLVTVGGNLTLGGTLNVAEAAGHEFESGVYRIIDYSGSLTNLGLRLGTAPVTGLSVQTAVPNEVNLVYPPSAEAPTLPGLVFWNGAASAASDGVIHGGAGSWQSSAGNHNWTDENASANTPFVDGSFAVFTSTPGHVTVDNSLGAVSAYGMQFAVDGYQVSGDPLTLVGTQALIRVGDGSQDSLGFTATISAPLAGGAMLVKDDAGTLVLSGSNTYTGGTRIEGGTVRVSSDGNLGDASGALTLAGGVLENTASFSSARNVSVENTGGIATDTGTQLTLSGPLGGSGTLTKYGTGTLALTGNGTFSGQAQITAGTLSVDGSVPGATVTMASGTTLIGNGTMGATTMQSGSTIAPGHSIGTLTVQGNYVQNAGAIYQVQLDPASTQSDLIHASGTATLAPGAVLQVSPIVNTPYSLGTRYTVLDADGGLTGSFGISGDTAVSPFATLQASYDANHAYLQVNQTRSLSDAACRRNPHAAAVGLQSAGGNNAALTAIVMDSQSDADACHDLGELSGEAYASVRGAFIDDSRFLREAVSYRMHGDSDSLSPTTDGNAGANGLWGHAFGSWGDYNSHNDTATFDRDIGGFFMGADRELGAAWRLGVVGGYSHTTFNVDSLNSSGSSDDYHVGLYTGNDQGQWRFNGGVAYTWHDVTMTRHPSYAGYQATLSSDYKAGTTQGWGEIAYDMQGHDADLLPFLNAAYVRLRSNGFQEQGDPATALSGHGDSNSNTFTTLGTRLIVPLNFTGHASLELRASVGWRHTFGQLTPSAALSFTGGTPFGVVGASLDRDALAADVGLGGNLARDIDAGITYSGLIGSNSSDHGVKAYLRWQF
ncbi:autotransporter domain-containing protein [Dyella sp. Tek66A03]|uniref:autotransporter domain-containing protein n=1 Tax=Dyella sp. Tek66A03 TaxID=3458298 RepID=UPI00403ECF87